MSLENKKTYIFNPGERIDIGTVDALNADIKRVIEEKGVDEIHIDLKFVQICDMYGINFLFDAFSLAKKAEIECSMSKPLPLIEEILIKSGLNKFKNFIKED